MRLPPLLPLPPNAAPVLWTWLVGVLLGVAVQVGEGLGLPSPGLALSAPALPAALVAAAPPRWRSGATAAAVALLCALALADALHYRAFDTYLSLGSLAAVGQLVEAGPSAAALLAPRDLLPAALLVTTLAAPRIFAVAAPRARPAGGTETRRLRAGSVVACLLGATPALAWAWSVSPGYADTDTGGFLYAHLVEARRRFGERTLGDEPPPAEAARIAALLHERRAERGADPWRGLAAGSNLLLVQVEALNSWVPEADVGGEPVMPFLRSLADRGVRFTHVFDAAHLGRSSDADYMVMASQHPLERDAVSMTRPGLDARALPAVLAEGGYATLSAHAHRPGFWNAAVRHRAYGFGSSLFDEQLGPGESLGFGLTDQVFLARAAERLVELPEPWMGWLITLTMHEPHTPVPEHFPALPLGDLEGTPLGAYLRKARHTDDAVRALVDRLDREGLLERTTLVVYGDHAGHVGMDMARVEALAGVAGLPADARRLLLERVPLVVVPPASAALPPLGLSAGAPATLLDLAPTAVSLLGLEAPPSWLGRSLSAGGRALAAHASGEAVGDGLMWTRSGCYRFAGVEPLPGPACDGLRARAREELEVSWTITRYGLAPRLDGEIRAP